MPGAAPVSYHPQSPVMSAGIALWLFISVLKQSFLGNTCNTYSCWDMYFLQLHRLYPPPHLPSRRRVWAPRSSTCSVFFVPFPSFLLLTSFFFLFSIFLSFFLSFFLSSDLLETGLNCKLSELLKSCKWIIIAWL